MVPATGTLITDQERNVSQAARQNIIKARDEVRSLESMTKASGSTRSQQYTKALAALNTAYEALDRARSMNR